MAEALALSIALGSRARPAPRLRLSVRSSAQTAAAVAAPQKEATARAAAAQKAAAEALAAPHPPPAAAAAKTRRASTKSAHPPSAARLVVPLPVSGGGGAPTTAQPPTSPPGIGPPAAPALPPSAAPRSQGSRAAAALRTPPSAALSLLLPPAPSLLRLRPQLALDASLPLDADEPEEEAEGEGEEADVDEEFFSQAAPAAVPGIPQPLLPIPEGARGWAAIKDTLLMGLGEHDSIPDSDWSALRARLPALQEHWRPMVSYLHSLGLRDAELSRLASKEPQIFTGNVGRARSRISFLRDSFSLTPADLVRVLATAPRVMFLRIERTLA